MLIEKDVLLLGEKLVLKGDEGDTYFSSFGADADLADSVVTGVLPLVPNDAVCLDIGANLGIYSIALARRFPDATVIACEPVPRTFECLVANLAANAPQCVALQVAVGAEPGTAHMNFAEHFAAGSHFSSTDSLVSIKNMGDTDVEVSVRTLDSIVEEQKLTRVDLIKIDVEGYEADVLAGGKTTFHDYRPIAQIEFNSWALSAHRQTLPQQALEDIMATFPFVYVHERHGDRFGRVKTEQDQLSLMRANMIHGSVDNLLCGFTELAPQAAPYTAVWQEFVRFEDAGVLSAQIRDLQQQLAGSQQQLAAAQQETAATRAAAQQHEAAIFATLSWRITQPLRAVRTLTRKP
jgi:FkbM family methyltransferase